MLILIMLIILIMMKTHIELSLEVWHHLTLVRHPLADHHFDSYHGNTDNDRGDNNDYENKNNRDMTIQYTTPRTPCPYVGSSVRNVFYLI